MVVVTEKQLRKKEEEKEIEGVKGAARKELK